MTRDEAIQEYRSMSLAKLLDIRFHRSYVKSCIEQVILEKAEAKEPEKTFDISDLPFIIKIQRHDGSYREIVLNEFGDVKM
ncbi:MAG: hypothetical protein JRC53_01105 [Deltaproteobacteria bacterium]|nr:hypothetical protein [Deltaproteobacteria bacterium]